LVVVILVELLMVPVAGGVAAGVWARAAEPTNKLRETRKPRRRFIMKL
jgi:hypothetical protein